VGLIIAIPWPRTLNILEAVAVYNVEIYEETLPKEFEDFAPLFSKEEASKVALVPNYSKVRYTIEIEEGKSIPYSRIYPISVNKLQVLWEYIEEALIKG
jgi:hypothetical protein